jgi:hypothetical protein
MYILATPCVIDSGRSIFDYEYLLELDSKIGIFTTIV